MGLPSEGSGGAGSIGRDNSRSASSINDGRAGWQGGGVFVAILALFTVILAKARIQRTKTPARTRDGPRRPLSSLDPRFREDDGMEEGARRPRAPNRRLSRLPGGLT
ncbi:hypothetical protein [Tistlia consotensis]|nr:hypothetical protein [Tistlia consotensis]